MIDQVSAGVKCHSSSCLVNTSLSSPGSRYLGIDPSHSVPSVTQNTGDSRQFYDGDGEYEECYQVCNVSPSYRLTDSALYSSIKL